jgi:hypothetical protein
MIRATPHPESTVSQSIFFSCLFFFLPTDRGLGDPDKDVICKFVRLGGWFGETAVVIDDKHCPIQPPQTAASLCPGGFQYIIWCFDWYEILQISTVAG